MSLINLTRENIYYWLYEAAKVVSVCLFILILYVIYLVTTGIPSTQARNLYNQALLTSNTNQKIQLLEASLGIWWSNDTAQELKTAQSNQ